MAKGNPKGNPQNLKPWPKGVSGNPSGQARVPEEIKRARQLTAIQFTELTTKYLNKNKEELLNAIKDPATPALELMIAQIMSKAIINGDQQRLNFLLDRLVGKVPDKVVQSITIKDNVDALLEEFNKLDESGAS